MDFMPLIDSTNDECRIRLINMMKAFQVPLDCSAIDLSDLPDIQTIMREGNVQDLNKCIQNVLHYNLSLLTNNSRIRILDPSLITLFHIAQFIIKFLLFWKAQLLKENTELINRLQEHEKLHQDYLQKKSEVRDLRKQLLYLRSKNFAASECWQCKKLFVNDAYLYAHHKRRHKSELFIPNRHKLQSYDGTSHNQQSINPLGKYHDIECSECASLSMKMKVTPEADCLKTQEKYWKGRLKELHDDCEEEKKRIQALFNRLEIENADLNRKINDANKIRETRSVGVQTECPEFYLDSVLNQHSRTKVSSSSSLLNSNIGRESLFQSVNVDVLPSCPGTIHRLNPITNLERWSLDTYGVHQQSSILEENNSNDIVDEVNAFLAHYNDKANAEEEKKFSALNNEEYTEEDKKVIARCFTSEQLVNKLIKIYNKQVSLVSDVRNLNECDAYDVDVTPSSKVGINTEDISEEILELIQKEPETIAEFNTTSAEVFAEGSSFGSCQTVPGTTGKAKSRIFPFLKNIPTKIMKNYTKSRKVCVNVIEDNIVQRFSSRTSIKESNDEELLGVKSYETGISKDQLLKSKPYEENLQFRNRSNEPKLTSVLKKSKSTGNLTKKVMFTDEVSRIRENNDSNSSEVCQSEHISTSEAHDNRISIPIPAPRARKNLP